MALRQNAGDNTTFFICCSVSHFINIQKIIRFERQAKMEWIHRLTFALCSHHSKSGLEVIVYIFFGNIQTNIHTWFELLHAHSMLCIVCLLLPAYSCEWKRKPIIFSQGCTHTICKHGIIFPLAWNTIDRTEMHSIVILLTCRHSVNSD